MAGKKLKAAKAQVDRLKLYQPLDAVRLLKSFETAKFDEAVEAHFRLGLNVRHADQQLRGSLMLPHGTGRTKTVAVFAQGDKAREAEEAGADYVGADDLATRVQAASAACSARRARCPTRAAARSRSTSRRRWRRSRPARSSTAPRTARASCTS